MAADEFFAWERKSDRLSILKNSDDSQLLQLKWTLLDMLRGVDVHVLERGAIEQYYPDNVIGTDKPSRAQDFCAKVVSREDMLSCCGEQEIVRNGKTVSDKEFNLIFSSIFGAPSE